MQDPSCLCDLHHRSWQWRILNPLSEARDWTRMVTSLVCYHWVTMGTPSLILLWVAIWLSNIIYWRNYLFLSVYSYFLCHRLIYHASVGLFLGSLFCSFGLYIWFCVSSILFLLLYLFFFFFFLAAPLAYWTSQARSLIGAIAAGLCHSHSNTGSEPHLQPIPQAHGDAGSLTHWVRPGIKPASSWFLVGFVNCWATKGTPWLL